MKDNHLVSEGSSLRGSVTHSIDSVGDIATQKMLVLREARQRAIDARLNADKALRDAEQAEDRLPTQQEEVALAANSARRKRAAAAARIAVENERLATARFHALEVEVLDWSQSKANVEAAARMVTQCRGEAERALDRLTVALAEFEDRSRDAEARELRLEAELAATRQHAKEMCVTVPAMASTVIAPSEVMPPPSAPTLVWPVPSSDGDPFALAAQRAQRAAERRAADAARARMSR